MASVSLRRAVPADIETIMEIERQPGFEHLVGRSARSIHEELIGDPGHAYLLGLGDGGAIFGFAILRDIGNPQGGLYLKRIAIRDPGQGRGSAFLAAVIDWGFSLGDSHRFHLDHFSDNLRAHRAYEKCGLREEGILREAHRLPDGRYADLTVMAILRQEWVVNRKNAARVEKLAGLTPLQQKLRAKGLANLAAARRDLFAPLGPGITPEAGADLITALWEGASRLHRHNSEASETARCPRLDDDGCGAAVRLLAADLDMTTPVDLVFSHSIAEAGSHTSWHERFAGAVSLELGEAIDVIDRLARADSPLFRDHIVIIDQARLWSIWIDDDDIVRTRAGR